jgi:hypothetical protein
MPEDAMCTDIHEDEKEMVDAMLLNVQVLSREGRLAEAKAAIVVLTSLYPLNADILFEHWKVSCLADDQSSADRTIVSAASNQAILPRFCHRLLKELSSRTDFSAFDRPVVRSHWQSLHPALAERFFACCLSQLPSPGEGAASDYTPSDAMPILRRLARLAGNPVPVWRRAAGLASALVRAAERRDVEEAPRKRAR